MSADRWRIYRFFGRPEVLPEDPSGRPEVLPEDPSGNPEVLLEDPSGRPSGRPEVQNTIKGSE